MLPQVETFRFAFNIANIDSGVRWVVLGLFFKLCLADNISDNFDWIWLPTNSAYVVWLGALAFAFRIYFDFAGYSLIALGLGKMFGIDLILNFTSPYTALNIQAFWHRWHRSLSTWFRDYLYFPLGGSRSKRWCLNLLIVFVVSGIWHGAGWNFVFWGAAHGLLLAGYRVVKGKCRLPKALSWGITMLFVTWTWLFFYQTDSSVLFNKLGALCSIESYQMGDLMAARRVFGNMGNAVNAFVWLGAGISIVFIEYFSMRKSGTPYGLFLNKGISVVLALLTLFTAPVVQNGFIYFSF